ncbi:MAG: carbohydrate kinase [Enterobacter kobei]|nr:carbohydrate kinase [Enterobacter kobei]
MKKNPTSIPHSIWPADELKRAEREAADSLGITLYELMQRAGQAAFTIAREQFPAAQHWLILCGHGNNGGDGYVVARLAAAAGIEVTLLAQESDKPLPEEAHAAREAWLDAGGTIHAPTLTWPEGVALIIDGVINAAHTVTFIALKPGLLTGKARDVVGQLHHHALGLERWLAGQETSITRFDATQLAVWFPPRRPTSHKGDNGRLAIVGGDHGTAGAIRMTGEAALRAGAGLVVGPGLGQQAWGKDALRKIENFRKPMLWDADALNLLALHPDKRHNRILTPHPGEAARLLNCSVAEIESDRLLSARRLVKRYGGVVVLKGAGTVVASENGETGIIDAGNAGMGSGGMGDVLSGIIGALAGQKHTLYDAACAGCVAHGAAADRLSARDGTRGMLATDLFSTLRRVVNPDVIDVNHD